MEVVVTTGAVSHAKLQSSSPQQTNIQLFCRLDALIVAQPTVSEYWRESQIHGIIQCVFLLINDDKWMTLHLFL